MKNNTKATHFLKGIGRAAIVIPAMGLAAHLFTGVMHDCSEDYSLKHRFETAYSFNTPEEHKHFHTTHKYISASVANRYGADYEFDDSQYTYDIKDRNYLASPYATYPATLLLGTIFALQAKKDDKKKLLVQQNER